jgi:hypothetical protein
MSKPLEIKIYQTELGYSILIDNVVPRDELGFEICFTSLNETLCYLFYDLGRKQPFNIIACEGDDSLEKTIDFELDFDLDGQAEKPTYKDNVITFKPKDKT